MRDQLMRLASSPSIRPVPTLHREPHKAKTCSAVVALVRSFSELVYEAVLDWTPPTKKSSHI